MTVTIRFKTWETQWNLEEVLDDEAGNWMLDGAQVQGGLTIGVEPKITRTSPVHLGSLTAFFAGNTHTHLVMDDDDDDGCLLCYRSSRAFENCMF